jgi:ribonuclease M5
VGNGKIVIREIIVVEGLHDKQAIDRAVVADCILTQGSTLSDRTMSMIERAQKTRGVIVFTDPDYVGERLRKKISQSIVGCKHAFLPQSEAMKDGDIGIENASPAAIRNALARARVHNGKQITANNSANTVADNDVSRDIDGSQHEGYAEDIEEAEVLPWSLMLAIGIVGRPDSKEIRIALADALHIGYANGKQFWNRLNQLRITEAELIDAVRRVANKR